MHNVLTVSKSAAIIKADRRSYTDLGRPCKRMLSFVPIDFPHTKARRHW
jgi:hypothetical protein